MLNKEANESVYWLELLKATDYLNKNEFENINNDAISILKLITSIIKTTKSQIISKQPILKTNNLQFIINRR
ncbi:four helix bundle protein [Flavobacterium sp. ov086]|nr:four helix bundle protein [Flavobacterium sp. ov086]